jgi:hypothetical protein
VPVSSAGVLGLAEGIETALSASSLFDVSLWRLRAMKGRWDDHATA